MLLDNSLHHHIHLIFLWHILYVSHLVLHIWVINHLFHLWHLNVNLYLKCFKTFFFWESRVIICAWRFLDLLNLHHSDLFHLILSMMHGILLEFLLSDTEFIDDLHHLWFNDLFFFLSHFHNDFFVLSIVLNGFSSLGNILLLLAWELHLCVSRAELKNFDEVFEIEVSTIFLSLEWA